MDCTAALKVSALENLNGSDELASSGFTAVAFVARAKEVRERQKELGRDEGRETEYPSMKVGHQVQAYVDTPFGNQPYLSLTTIQGIETYCSDDLIASSQADIRAIVYDCTERKLATDGLARVDKENPIVEYGLR